MFKSCKEKNYLLEKQALQKNNIKSPFCETLKVKKQI